MDGKAAAKAYLPRGRRRVGFVTVSDGAQSAVIMIGPVRGPEHLELIRRARFYHVPVSAIAASRTGVAYIAFYEGKSRFRGKTGVIQEYAPVVGVSRVRRRDLPGLTWAGRRGEDAWYFRFDLGTVLTLPQPITNPDRLRVAFRFPNLDRFRAVSTVRELGQHRPRLRRRQEREGGEEGV
jgi:hypothetical protein